MKIDKKVWSKRIDLVAKIWSLIIMGCLVFMLIGSIVSPDPGDGPIKTIEIIAGVFFPVGAVLGMILSWRKQILGGVITIISMIIFSILILIPRGVDFERGAWIFILIGLPGVLFVMAGLLVWDDRKIVG
jgi:hypothetical protein